LVENPFKNNIDSTFIQEERLEAIAYSEVFHIMKLMIYKVYHYHLYE